MKNLVLHESVLALGTEGFFYGENDKDIRLPHWPKGNSGITIGAGFDIGASRISEKGLRELLSILAVPEPMILELVSAVGLTGKAAEQMLLKSNLRQKVRLTQQQALDIMLLVKQRFTVTVQKGFSKSYPLLYPAIIEVLVKLAYGAPALVSGWSNMGFKGLGSMFDAQFSLLNNPIQQCKLCLELLDTIIQFPWPSEEVKRVHGNAAKGLKVFMNTIINTLEAGGKVTILKGPIEIDKLLDTSNQTIELAALVSTHTHPNVVAINPGLLRKNLLEARAQEPKKMEDICNSLSTKLPPLKGTTLNESSISQGLKALDLKDTSLLEAQQKLIQLGYYDKLGITGGAKNADGIFGPNTQKVLRLFQSEKGLVSTGLLDKETKELLLGGGFWKQTEITAKNVDNKEKLLAEIKEALAGKGSISASVGEGAVNKKRDVLLVRALLISKGYLPKAQFQNSKETGVEQLAKVDKEFLAAILNFQKEVVGFAKPDGRIDVDGKTIRALNEGGLVNQILKQANKPIEDDFVVEPLTASAGFFPCFN